ncbi:MAG: bacteriophage holin [Nanoarchaeota archaeon]|nr:bacteriophage holin [Nanoarchaeota archaeon]MBU4116300.1 bacteriophage holin [Nanoarchaeota archaeon]
MAKKKRLTKAIKTLTTPKQTKINPKSAGLSLGILFAVSMIFFSLWVIIFGTGQVIINLAAIFYIGYNTTITGMLLGAIYGFIDGFIAGYLLAWIYNKLG